MPRRTDINTIMIIGAGPIVIGQACEFDYSGVQACRALREEGYRVALINSNPATIMTDPDTADATYIEPIEWPVVAEIMRSEKVDALLPTMGGQTALNCALDLARNGVLDDLGIHMIGADCKAIDKAEDRKQFSNAMRAIDLETPNSALAHSMEEAWQVLDQIGFPAVIRPSFTLGGSGGGIAYNREEYEQICKTGLRLSPTSELMIDESLIGWKEFEMEVVRDYKDNCMIVCTIENLDPMGIHTGDSITVAPAQTLTDREYQQMRNSAIMVLREIGVETGGSNVQFAVNPVDGRQLVIEMNPRVSRSSALASKATGFPIARVAAKLAVGFSLDELRNEMTGGVTPVSFEPTLDYVVTKIPRFDFDKFPTTASTLGTQMKSVGEVMAIGRNFQESLQKAICGLEIGRNGLDSMVNIKHRDAKAQVRRALKETGSDRLWYLADAFRLGFTQKEVHDYTCIDPWFLYWIEDLVKEEQALAGKQLGDMTREHFLRLKCKGFSDTRLALLLGCDEMRLRAKRLKLDVHPVFRRVDTCAAEFPACTAYLYSSYGERCEAAPSKRRKIMILGSGPNRIGQGIEFDYCCVHATLCGREHNIESIMVNCNPETVSTDYDTSDRLYFEPITTEKVLDIVDIEQPEGIIVQLGGQTPLKLVKDLDRAGVNILGTATDAIDCAEDRDRFQEIITQLGLNQPANATATNKKEALKAASKVGYPLVVRPSYVLGGRAMEVVHDDTELSRYMSDAVHVSAQAPVLLDRFLDLAVEVDVDAVSDGKTVVIGGVMQHIEQAGVHSGDSACVLPPYDLSEAVQMEMRRIVVKLARALKVVGLINVQFAVQNNTVYVLEVNPRAARTVPFISKAIGVSLVAAAVNCMVGRTLAEQGFTTERIPKLYFVKESVFPFNKFHGVDPILGPEMKSTGEVMGIGSCFIDAFARAGRATGTSLPKPPKPGRTIAALLSVRDADHDALPALAAKLRDLDFKLLATHGTARTLQEHGFTVERVNKVREGRPHVVDYIKNGQVNFIVNTTEGRQSIADSATIRQSALQWGVAYTTTIAAAQASCGVMAADIDTKIELHRLQSLVSDDHFVGVPDVASRRSS